MSHRDCRNTALILLIAGLVVLCGCSREGNATSSAAQSASQAASSSVSAESSVPASSQVAVSSSVSSETSIAVAESTKADQSYLDDAVFIGDSVSLKLKNFVTAKRKTDSGFFGKAQFLAAGSMGSANALKPLSESSIHPLYNGKKALLEDSVAAMGAKKVYIMLGTNDIAVYGIDGSVKNMEKLLANIKAKSPDALICVQSSTPMIKKKQMAKLNNPNLQAYDTALGKMCQQNGYYFIDIASVMRDTEGNLPLEYCSDPDNLGIHFTDKACEVWINYILTHTVK